MNNNQQAQHKLVSRLLAASCSEHSQPSGESEEVGIQIHSPHLLYCNVFTVAIWQFGKVNSSFSSIGVGLPSPSSFPLLALKESLLDTLVLDFFASPLLSS